MKCKKCGLEKPQEEFIKNKNCKNGRAGTCKKCMNDYSKKWKRKIWDTILARARKRYAETEGLEVKKKR